MLKTSFPIAVSSTMTGQVTIASEPTHSPVAYALGNELLARKTWARYYSWVQVDQHYQAQ